MSAIDLEAIEKRQVKCEEMGRAKNLPLAPWLNDRRALIDEVKRLRSTVKYHTYEALQAELTAVRAAVVEESQRADGLKAENEKLRELVKPNVLAGLDAVGKLIAARNRAEAAARELRDTLLCVGGNSLIQYQPMIQETLEATKWLLDTGGTNDG